MGILRKNKGKMCHGPVCKTVCCLLVVVGAAVLQLSIEGGHFQKTDVTGKRILICGASKGIGEQLVYEYAKAGANLVIVARSKDLLDKIARRAHEISPIDITVDVFPADLSLEENAVKIVEHSAKVFRGRLDIVVLMHIKKDGGASWGTWSGTNGIASNELIKSTFAVNTFSYIHITTAALPYLEKSNGSIVVVSSGTGKMGMPKVALYAATKHALHGFFDSLRHELVLRKVNVAITMCILGLIDTPATRESQVNTDLNPNLLNWRHSVEECAFFIMRASILRMREAYYPFHLMYPSVLARTVFPDWFDALLRVTVLSEKGWQP